MKSFPSTTTVSEADSSLFSSGHLWLLELIDGAPLQFRMTNSGVIEFGDRHQTSTDLGTFPPAYQHALNHIQDRLDRDMLRDAVANPTDVVFFGRATQRQHIAYEWHRTPSFIGYDVWSSASSSFLPPDAIEQIFQRLGLDPVLAIERERHTRDFDPTGYQMPDSQYYDGSAAGVVVRNKRGGRVTIHNDHLDEIAPPPLPSSSASELIRTVLPPGEVERLASAVASRSGGLSYETLFDRALDEVYRRAHQVIGAGEQSISPESVRDELGAMIRTQCG